VLGDGHLVFGWLCESADNQGLLDFDVWCLNCLLDVAQEVDICQP